jgi:hypothetical protein
MVLLICNWKYGFRHMEQSYLVLSICGTVLLGNVVYHVVMVAFFLCSACGIVVSIVMRCCGWRGKLRQEPPEGPEDAAGALIVGEDVGEEASTILEGWAMRSQEMELTPEEGFVEAWTEIASRVPLPRQPAFHVTYGHLIDHRCVFSVLSLQYIASATLGCLE